MGLEHLVPQGIALPQPKGSGRPPTPAHAHSLRQPAPLHGAGLEATMQRDWVQKHKARRLCSDTNQSKSGLSLLPQRKQALRTALTHVS